MAAWNKSRWFRRSLVLGGLSLGVLAIGYGTFHWLTSGDTREVADTPTVPKPAPQRSGPSHPLDSVLEMAYEQKKLIARPDFADYTATFIKRERSRGKLNEEVMAIKVRNRRFEGDRLVTPFGVYLKFLQPAGMKGREVIWVEGKNSGNMIAHEAGLAGFFRTKLAPTSPLAMLGNRYPVSDIGIENLVNKMITRCEETRTNKSVAVSETSVEFAGRKCRRIEIRFTERQPEFESSYAIMDIDEAFNLPVHFAAYCWPTADEPAAVDEEYIYKDIKWNTGLSDQDFDPDNPDYDYP